MACFVAPVTEAVATTIVTKIVSRKESPASEGTIPLSRKLGWLNKTVLFRPFCFGKAGLLFRGFF